MKTFGVVREENKKSTVFVNKINNLATQSWKKILAYCFIENKKKIIWPELSKQCYITCPALCVE